jgi:Flp pilus assembly pilin Flp
MPNRRQHLHPLNDRAQTLAEYSLLLGLIFVAVAVTVPGLAGGIDGLYAGALAFFGG